MNKKNSADYEQLYFNMKKDYDSLLEKNQNDLIKIRIREKTLNVDSVRFRKEYSRSKGKDKNR